MEQTTVVVGASHAAAQAVESLRREGLKGRLVLVGDEPHLPYQRPPLSKKYLSGEFERERLWIKPQSFYESHGVELMLGRRAVSLDAAARVLELDGGTPLRYDQLLLATGSRPRPLDAPGAGLAGVHYLRSIADVDGIRADLKPGQRVVIVGAGYIGLECAASCVKLGLDVTVLEMAERVMSRVVAPQMSAFYAGEHAAHGVAIHCDTLVAALDGDGRVREVVCRDGRRFPADLVIVGIGILPNVELARDAGIACDNGIAVDAHCRTSDPAVYAIGDCCSHPSPHYGRRVRLESVDNAFEQAKTAAANMCGRETVHDRIPWFWSDQYELKLQIVGLAQGYDRVVLRGDPAGRAFSCCYLRGRELLAIDCVNQARDFMAGKKVIAERPEMDLAKLGDAAVPLREAI